VEVEVDLASGFPGFATVGLPDNIVKASRCDPEADDR
jgi:predicted ATPase with chaperone activity